MQKAAPKKTLQSKNEKILKSAENGHFDNFARGLIRQNGQKWPIWRAKVTVQKNKENIQNQVGLSLNLDESTLELS